MRAEGRRGPERPGRGALQRSPTTREPVGPESGVGICRDGILRPDAFTDTGRSVLSESDRFARDGRRRTGGQTADRRTDGGRLFDFAGILSRRKNGTGRAFRPGRRRNSSARRFASRTTSRGRRTSSWRSPDRGKSSSSSPGRSKYPRGRPVAAPWSRLRPMRGSSRRGGVFPCKREWRRAGSLFSKTSTTSTRCPGGPSSSRAATRPILSA